MKEIAPDNSLGIYLINKKISNADIYASTDIPETDLSRYRNGEITAIPAKRLYLIYLFSGDSIGVVLKATYPNLTLQYIDNPQSNKIKEKTTSIGKLLFSLEEGTFEIISYKTGIKISRLRNLATKDSTIISSHELYLIEQATNREPGSLFIQLFSDLKLKTKS